MDNTDKSASKKSSVLSRPSISWFRKTTSVERNPEKSSKDTYEMLVDILSSYEAIEANSLTTPSSALRTHTSTKSNRASLAHTLAQKNEELDIDGCSLHNSSMTFVFYLLNLTLEEFYTSYLEYYKQYDSDCDFCINRHEFYVLLDYLAKPTSVGKPKMLKSFQVYSQEHYRGWNSVAVLNPTSSDRLEQVFKEGLYTILSVRTKSVDSSQVESYIHYRRFLPLIISYFSEYIRQKTISRTLNMGIISGLNINRATAANTGISLLEKLESIGYPYRGDVGPTLIPLKALESALILFRNNYTQTFDQQQLEMVLKELRDKYKAKDASTLSEKTIKLNTKLIEWLTYRVCLHGSLYNLIKNSRGKPLSKLMVLDEYTIWAAARGAKQFTNKTCQVRFKKYAQKRRGTSSYTDLDDPDTEQRLKSILKGFCRKLLPHISEASVKRMYAEFCEGNKIYAHDVDHLDLMGDRIFSLMIKEANTKLRDFVDTVHQGASSPVKRHSIKGVDDWKDFDPQIFATENADNSEVVKENLNTSRVYIESLENMLNRILGTDPEVNNNNNESNNDSLSLNGGLLDLVGGRR